MPVTPKPVLSLTEPPDPPTEVNGVILGSYNNSALVSWLSSGNIACPITRYILQLHRTDSSTKSWNQVADDITSTAHVVENLERGVDYVFRVCAMNEIGCGKFSRPSPPLTITDTPGQLVRIGHVFVTVEYPIKDTPLYIGVCTLIKLPSQIGRLKGICRSPAPLGVPLNLV